MSHIYPTSPEKMSSYKILKYKNDTSIVMSTKKDLFGVL